MKTYDSYKDSGIEWIENIPSHWNNVSIKWISQIFAGGTPSKNNDEYWLNGTIPWLNSGTVNQGYITEPSELISELGFEKSSAKWIPAKALVIALAGQGKTKGTVAQLGFEATCNQSMAAIIPHKSLNPRFLMYWLKSNYQNIRNLGGGDLRDGLNLEMIGSIKSPIPLEEEQSTIASYLDKKTAEIDELIADKKRLLELYEEEKSALINRAVTKGINPDAPLKDSGIGWLGEIPEHWKVKKLRHIKAPIKNSFVDGPFGSNLKTEHFIENGDVYVIDSGFITSGKFEFNREFKTISFEHFLTVNRSECNYRDIIIAKIGANFGMSGILPKLEKPSLVSGNTLKLTVNKDKYDIDFIHKQLLCLKWAGEIDLLVKGSAQPALSMGPMSELSFAIPNTLEEQKAIINHIEFEYKLLDNKISKTQKLIELLTEYRTALISEVVTGKVKVID
jgi:type I restriction enzyme S subunit